MVKFYIKLGFYILKTDISIQKIEGSKPQTFEIVITSLIMDNKDKKSYFFKKIFQFAKMSMNVLFVITFLTLSNIKINFNNYKLKQILYTIEEAFFTTR